MEKKSSTGLVAVLIVACVLLAGLSACVLFVLNNSSVPQEAVLQELGITRDAEFPEEKNV